MPDFAAVGTPPPLDHTKPETSIASTIFGNQIVQTMKRELEVGRYRIGARHASGGG